VTLTFFHHLKDTTDDVPDILESLQRMLSSRYRVDTACTGSEVLHKCATEAYDALIIDVDLGPGISGLEVAALLRVHNKSIPILVFSAIEYSDAVRQQVVDLGAVFGEKPLALDFVVRFVEGRIL